MVEKYNIRTDLALEEKERFESDQVEVQGVVLEEEYDKEREIRVTTVRIETENGAKTMGKPVGTYLTIEAPNLSSPDEGIHREVSEELAKYLIEVMEKIIPESEHDKEVLVIGLGNRQATPDALGPYVAESERYQTYCKRIWEICSTRRDELCSQRHSSRSDGTDRNGNSGDYKGCGEGDQARSFNCN